MKKTLTKLKRETDNSTITVGDFSIPLSLRTDGTTKQKINK
jgi:hypothetical protein